MIRNVCIHMANEQPLLADLFEIPSATDAGLVCTNLRMLDGKRPVFIDQVQSTFFFPYRAIRFLEIPPGELERHQSEVGSPSAFVRRTGADGVDTVAGAGFDPSQRLPVPFSAPDEGAVEVEADADLEIDADFLQRIRDI